MTWFFKVDANPGATLLAGTVSTTSGSATITGSGTSFLTDFKQDDVIGITNGSALIIRQVQSVASNTSMTVTTTLSNTLSGVTYGNRTQATFLRQSLWPAAGAGTVATTSGSAIITGTGTTFSQYISAGTYIKVTGGDVLKIHSVDSDTQLTACTNASTTVSGAAYQNQFLIQYSGGNSPTTAAPVMSVSNVASPTPGQTGPDTCEHTLTNFWCMDQLGLSTGATRDLFTYYTDANAYIWCAFSDDMYSLVQPTLSTSEAASLTQSSAGLTARSYRCDHPIDWTKTNIITVGDSITDAVGFGALTSTGTFQYQMLPLLKGSVGPTYDGGVTNNTLVPSTAQQAKQYENRQYCIRNLGQGSASWMNINSTAGKPIDWTHHWNEMIYQKLMALPVPPAGSKPYYVVVWLGTNDCNYSLGSITGAQVWARAVTWITALRTKFNSSQMKVIICTAATRQNASQTTMNSTLDAYNQLIRANALSVGFDAICDLERDVVDNSGIYKTAPYYPLRCGVTYTPAGDLTNFTVAGPGTVSTTNGSATITGVGTNFLSFFYAGQAITVAGGDTLQIQSVQSNTSMTATAASTTVSGASYTCNRVYFYDANTSATHPTSYVYGLVAQALANTLNPMF